ncbi:hypothetical protein Huta_2869 [Halorhabdus utahensis DSM 12940]|uniref:Uncharacterized protein n=1 Tax=Halorhabdus utahensis (strain DSM 12940 / JCM 11049 / AX-2) TaxID=519442 RepID=C7NRS5_HALUD|nr:hypothetical protein [Halorhabdus utahensis]ACV13030.1 hypothetical protein Huta_2869 [Halorhabdus utahensis DSM 12940]
MARVTDRRGQMILIGGVLLAVTIIALAVVFNSAIYTTVLAGESQDDVSSREPLGFQQEVRQLVGATVERAVQQRSSLNKQKDYVTNNLSAVRENLRRYQADANRLVDVSVASNISGAFIYNSTGSFVNETGHDDWEVGTGLRVRNMSFDVSSTSGFIVEITGDGGDAYELDIGSDVAVTGPTTSKTCSWSGSGHVNITESTINGDRCNALDFFERLEAPYDIQFRQGSNAQGRYSLLVTPSGSISSDVASQDRTDRLFGVDVATEYVTTEIDWETTLRVAPGEPP